MDQQGGWYIVPKRKRNVDRCCVCSNAFQIHHKKHMCRMCGCFMHARSGCTYDFIKKFTDENGNEDGPFCYRCIDDLRSHGIIDEDINSNPIDNIIRDCFSGISSHDPTSKNKWYNEKLKEIAEQRPKGEPKNKKDVQKRIKYFEDKFKTLFLEMIDDSPLIKNSDELFEFCKRCTSNLIAKQLTEAKGQENEGMFVDSKEDIIYKVLSVLDNNPSKNKILELVLREWYYSNVGFNLGIAPEPFFIHICRSYVDVKMDGGRKKITRRKFRKTQKKKTRRKNKKTKKLSGGAAGEIEAVLRYFFILSYEIMIPLSDMDEKAISNLDEQEVLDFPIILKENGLRHGDGHDQNMVYNEKKNKILLIDWAHAKEEKYEQGKGEPFIIPGIGDDDY